MGKFSSGMSALGKGLAAWAEKATPLELKLSNIGKPVEVRTWIRLPDGTVENESMTTYAGTLKSYAIYCDGIEINLVGIDNIEVGFKTHRVEVNVAA